MFGALAEIPQPRVAYAILKAAYTCPKDKLDNKFCVWIRPSEVTQLAKSTKLGIVDRLRSANDFLVATREVLESVLVGAQRGLAPAGLTTQKTDADRIQAKTDIAVGRYVTQKTDKVADGKGQAPHVDLGTLGRDFRILVLVAFPNAKKAFLESKWPAEAETTVPTVSQTTTKDAVKVTMYELDASGGTRDGIASLRKEGFDIGSHVGCDQNDAVYEIQQVESGAMPKVMFKLVAPSTIVNGLLEVLARGRVPAVDTIVEVVTPACDPDSSASSGVGAIEAPAVNKQTLPPILMISVHTFLADYRQRVCKGSPPALNSNWPSQRPLRKGKLQLSGLRAAVQLALYNLIAQVDAIVRPDELVTIIGKPKQEARALGDATLGLDL